MVSDCGRAIARDIDEDKITNRRYHVVTRFWGKAN